MATNNNFDSLFEDISDEDLNATAGAIKEASDVESDGSRLIKWAGQYVMRAKTEAYKKDDEVKIFPSVVKASTGTIMLSLKLEVADEGDHITKKGDTIYSNITLIMPNADDEKRKKVANITKPRLIALTGNAKVDFTKEWIHDNLTIDVDDKLNITRHHKLTELVMATVVVKMDSNGKDKAEVTSVRPLPEGFKTITDEASYKDYLETKKAEDAARAGGSAAATANAPASYSATTSTEAGSDTQTGFTGTPVEDDMPF